MHAWLATIETTMEREKFHDIRKTYHALEHGYFDIDKAAREICNGIRPDNQQSLIALEYIGPLYLSINLQQQPKG